MTRQTKLAALIESLFGNNQAAFAAAIKRSTAQVNQWLSGHRRLGDAGARVIELALNLRPGYFDEKIPTTPKTADDATVGEVVALMREMPIARRAQVLAFAQGLAAKDKE